MSVHTEEPSVTLLFCDACDKEKREGSFGFSLEGALEHANNMGKGPHQLFTPQSVGQSYAKTINRYLASK